MSRRFESYRKLKSPLEEKITGQQNANEASGWRRHDVVWYKKQTLMQSDTHTYKETYS